MLASPKLPSEGGVHLYIVMKHIVALSAILAVLGRTTDYGPLPFVHPSIQQSSLSGPAFIHLPFTTRFTFRSPSSIQPDTTGYKRIQLDTAKKRFSIHGRLSSVVGSVRCLWRLLFKFVFISIDSWFTVLVFASSSLRVFALKSLPPISVD